MLKFKDFLLQNFGGRFDEEEKKLLPDGFQTIGDVAIFQLKPPLQKFKFEIAELMLKEMPYLKTVCMKSGFVSGEFREPQIEKLVGDGTEAVTKENGCLFKMDVIKLMFAKGNKSERMRLANLVKENEVVVDLFAGLGYFTIPIAVHSPVKKIYSIEKNPVAFHYLKGNILLNRIGGKVIPIEGDCTLEAPKLGKIADRVLLGLLPAPKFALPAAFAVAKENAKFHYEGIWYEEDSVEDTVFLDVVEAARKSNRKVTLQHVQRVKSFGPHRYHVVLDVSLD